MTVSSSLRLDAKKIRCVSVGERPNRTDLHDLDFPDLERAIPSSGLGSCCDCEVVKMLGEFLTRSRTGDTARIVLTGGHLIKAGLSLYLIDLIERGVITHVATNGAALIHDFELALIGGTSEDVAKWLKVGQFGLWKETGRLNDVINKAARRGEGMGEGIGRAIEEEEFPHRDISIAAACYRHGVPLTCHVSIGSDIIHCHPNCNGAAIGQTSYLDFLRFAGSVQSRGVKTKKGLTAFAVSPLIPECPREDSNLHGVYPH